MRLALGGLVVAVAMVAAGCGGAEMSLTEYVDRLNTLSEKATARGEAIITTGTGAVLVAEGQTFLEYTPNDLQLALEAAGEIELEFLEAAGGMNPPAALADLHRLWFNTEFTAAREAVASRAGRVASWEELSATQEMADYRVALAADKQVCLDFQSRLDATADLGVFEDVPWLPSELGEVVEAALGCDWWPEQPENMYRP